MTRVLLVRHARCQGTGDRLHGRAPGVRLSAAGEREAQALAARLANEPLHAVYASPVERAVQTAAAVAAPHGLEPVLDAAFEELDFGEWTGSGIAALSGDDWSAFNALRSLAPARGGELMLAVQARAVHGLLALRQRHDGATLAIVTHADVIRALLAHVLGMPLDNVLRLEVEPASVSIVHFDGLWPSVQSLNSTYA